ncbi:MAG: lipo-like protein [Deltaproteobacteria bacterium]|nr:MAG: lipo-like protein [Deltaproteobacteria bacterium]
MSIFQVVGRRLARYLSRPRDNTAQVATCTPENLAAAIQPGDVLLVEGSSGFSNAIKYLTQSSWSHATLYIGNRLDPPSAKAQARVLVEADVNEGVRAVPLNKYVSQHTRICRPIGLAPKEIKHVIEYTISRLGHRYDLKNIIDLVRYLIQTPPVPTHLRRRLLALGSGDPTRAICSSLIAQAFQSVQYPILPHVISETSQKPACAKTHPDMLRIRHHTLFTPRDFDVSPYFSIIKPTIEHGFDPYALSWASARN